MSFTADLALWSLIVFVLFLFILKKFAWLPMIEGLDKREAGIRKAIADAEDGRRKSQALLAEYEQKLKTAEQTVQAMVAEARRDAERTSQDLIASAQREVEADSGSCEGRYSSGKGYCTVGSVHADEFSGCAGNGTCSRACVAGCRSGSPGE